MYAAEIAVRLGDTLLDVARIGAGERFTIGMRPGVQLAIAGIGEFPLVEARGAQFVVRAPIGEAPSVDGDRRDGELVLGFGERVSLALGLARVDIELVRVERSLVPRPPVDARPVAYIGTTLFAHLALWAAAAVIAPFVPFGHHGRARPKYIAASVATPPKVELEPAPIRPPPDPRAGPHATPPRPHHASAAEPPKSGRIETVEAAVGELSTLDVAGALQQVGPAYRDYENGGFGSTRHFDPTDRDGWGTVASGAFQTLSHGAGTGDDYELADRTGPRLCARPGCSGPLGEAVVRAALEPMVDGLASCAGEQHGVAILTLQVDREAKIASITMRSGYVGGSFAPCASSLLASLQLPAAAAESQVVVPIAF